MLASARVRCSCGHTVLVTGATSSAATRPPPFATEVVYVVHGGITGAKLLAKLFDAVPFKHVFHLAAQAGVRYALVDPMSYVRANLPRLARGGAGSQPSARHHRRLRCTGARVYRPSTDLHTGLKHFVRCYPELAKKQKLHTSRNGKVHVVGMAAPVAHDDCLFSIFVTSPDGVCEFYLHSLIHQIQRLIFAQQILEVE